MSSVDQQKTTIEISSEYEIVSVDSIDLKDESNREKAFIFTSDNGDIFLLEPELGTQFDVVFDMARLTQRRLIVLKSGENSKMTEGNLYYLFSSSLKASPKNLLITNTEKASFACLNLIQRFCYSKVADTIANHTSTMIISSIDKHIRERLEKIRERSQDFKGDHTLTPENLICTTAKEGAPATTTTIDTHLTLDTNSLFEVTNFQPDPNIAVKASFHGPHSDTFRYTGEKYAS